MTATTFTIGQTVNATFMGAAAHKPTVQGVIAAIRETARGVWYEVSHSVDQTNSFRAAQLSAA